MYEIIQQVVRMDPGYYMLFVCLRPDHNKWLISCPYYTKDPDQGPRRSDNLTSC